MLSRRERKRLEQERTQHAERQRTVLLGGGTIAAVIILALVVVQSGILNSPPPPVAQSSTGTCGNVQAFPSLGQAHIQPNEPHVPYNSNPPTSGPHWDTPQNQGIYTTPQVQEQLVHNLEHGFVIIQYKDLTAEEVQRLAELVRRDPYHLILAPYPGLPGDAKVALTAWIGPNGQVQLQSGKLQTCTGVDENAIRGFINVFRDKGPEKVP